LSPKLIFPLIIADKKDADFADFIASIFLRHSSPSLFFSVVKKI
jgi:hypothetical protein